MPNNRQRLELLAPARNADFGIEAIRHGADAVYIGAPAFGARAAASASIADIERLASCARRFNARTLVALNTLLFDDELESAQKLVWQIFEAGADALIVQDMGLLELDLPPIALHASTQTDIRTPEKARFLNDAGFSQIVLARELNLMEIRAIAEATGVTGAAASEAANASRPLTLEFFVHGALCVSYSGQCYLSHALGGRSANRGECAQPCRLPWTLADGDGRVIARDRHLLSLKDNEQSDNLAALIDAGVRSFKIEGRLKDLAYVKNVTAHYRQRLDALLADLPGFSRASSGRSEFTFTPQPEKTFNRGRSDYFVNGRQSTIADFDSPGFAGEAIGRVKSVGRDFVDIESESALANGDGIAFFGADDTVRGLRVNRVEPRTELRSEKPARIWRVWPAPGDSEATRALQAGQTIYRNRDQDFVRRLEKPSAERRIAVSLRLAEARGANDASEGYELHVSDEAGIAVRAFAEQAWQAASDPERAAAALRTALSRLGETIYVADRIELAMSEARFIPVSLINALRRQAVAELDRAREAAAQMALREYRRLAETSPPPRWPQTKLDYRANVANAAARAFWHRHGVEEIDAALESGTEARGKTGEVALMTLRHCLRFSFGGCPRLGAETAGAKAAGADSPLERKPTPLVLARGKQRFTLRFDCKRCEMQLVGQPGGKKAGEHGAPTT